MRARRNCCVMNCRNSESTCDKSIKFYSFPGKNYEVQRKQRWIRAIGRINSDGTPWLPTNSSRVCSSHFIGGKKVDVENHPGYIPKIFPGCSEPSISIGAINRCERIIKRFVSKRSVKASKTKNVEIKGVDVQTQIATEYDTSKFIFISCSDGNNLSTLCNIGYVAVSPNKNRRNISCQTTKFIFPKITNAIL